LATAIFWRRRASGKVKYFFDVTREKFSRCIALTLVSYARTVPTFLKKAPCAKKCQSEKPKVGRANFSAKPMLCQVFFGTRT